MKTTRDTLWNGDLLFEQPARGYGYRFNLDPILLSGFVSPAVQVVDLGAGIGIIGILLLAMGKAKQVTAVEIQTSLAQLADKNIQNNGYTNRMKIINDDLRQVEISHADLVVFNPPYFRNNEGHGASEYSRDIARHERNGTLADFVAKAIKLATRPKNTHAVHSIIGRVGAIIPVRRGEELEKLLISNKHITILRRRFVQPREQSAAKYLLIEASYQEHNEIYKNNTLTENPLIVHKDDGRSYTDEVCELLRDW
ncbi:MAG: methyltransferase [Deltaproteobacteria bacterium]|nr:methyltransferase [Deltaproteobacteria bacterium]